MLFQLQITYPEATSVISQWLSGLEVQVGMNQLRLKHSASQI